MRKILFVSLVLLVLFSFTGCKEETYAFKKTVNEIERVEIVSTKNSSAFTVIKTLSETEKNDFIERFQTIKFNNYFIGDPMSVSGNAVKITYQNEDYEMVCCYWDEYIENGKVYFIRKSCNEKELNELLDSFLG